MNQKNHSSDNVPALRFPEFKGEWSKDKLGNIFDISAGGDIEKTNVSEKKTDIFKYPIYANAERDKGLYGYSNIYRIKENVITVAGRGVNIGIAHARDHKFYPIVRLLVLEPKNDEDIYFFEYQINRLNLYKESTGVPQLTAPQVSGYEVSFPKKSEQVKIGSFLRKVDEKIQALKKKHSLLAQYKKGVMQRLFCLNHDSPDYHDEHDLDISPPKNQGNQENHKKSRFRQKDGSNFPDWERKKLGEVCEIKKGEQLNKEELTENGSFPCLNGGINFSGFTEKFNSEENTITISEGGNSCGYINYMKTKFWLGGHCYKVLLSDEIHKNYFYQLLKFNEKRIMNLRVGSGLPNIQLKDLKSFELLMCNSIEEQTLIANFLSAIDEKINQTQSQIEKTEHWKKGLLQKMFV